MSTSTAAPQETVGAVHERATLAGALRAYVEKVKAGDVGSLPVVLGMIVIVIFFTAQSTVFFTAVNFDNIITQMAGTTLIAIGVVFVLLIGEIDLSIGYVSGMAGVAVAYFQVPGSGHDLPGIVAILIALGVGALIGLLQGSFVAIIGVPSFVVTLAGFFVWQGVIIRWIGDQGVIGIQDKYVNDTANLFLQDWVGWALAAVVVGATAAVELAGIYSRRRADLPVQSMTLVVIRIAFVAVVAVVAVTIANRDRGVPFAGVLMLAFLVFWTFVATRTTFGRHVYAVGGNAEASRRAGINVQFIKIVVFMISGGMAAMGGIVLAARLSSVDLNAGGGTILLEAIAAAVIGGTSLFGGRGRVVAALLGSLVIATIANGLSLIGSPDATKLITTGVILLAAVVLDTVSRRRLAKSGR